MWGAQHGVHGMGCMVWGAQFGMHGVGCMARDTRLQWDRTCHAGHAARGGMCCTGCCVRCQAAGDGMCHAGHAARGGTCCTGCCMKCQAAGDGMCCTGHAMWDAGLQEEWRGCGGCPPRRRAGRAAEWGMPGTVPAGSSGRKGRTLWVPLQSALLLQLPPQGTACGQPARTAPQDPSPSSAAGSPAGLALPHLFSFSSP